MRINFLGTGDAFCSEGRANTSILIDSEYRVLFDCGPQTVYNLRRLNYKVSDVDYIFLSHLHGDHSGGLPFIILALKFREPSRIAVVGPINTPSFIDKIYGGYYGIGNSSEVLDFRSLQDPYPFEFSFMAANHTVEAYIYKVKMESKTIVYSGDTSILDLTTFAHNADLLIHEASEIDEGRAQLYGHSTPLQAAKLAADAGVKQLALVHRPHLDCTIVSKTRSIFPNTFFPNDLDQLDI
ncbi:MAG: MBL fold metallo-hydrolase [Thaumarchaeota archaeon]|nr:MBL fold metallo-hydrolase [Nitrososphaerota archaeon]